MAIAVMSSDCGTPLTNSPTEAMTESTASSGVPPAQARSARTSLSSAYGAPVRKGERKRAAADRLPALAIAVAAGVRVFLVHAAGEYQQTGGFPRVTFGGGGGYDSAVDSRFAVHPPCRAQKSVLPISWPRSARS